MCMSCVYTQDFTANQGHIQEKWQQKDEEQSASTNKQFLHPYWQNYSNYKLWKDLNRCWGVWNKSWMDPGKNSKMYSEE